MNKTDILNRGILLLLFLGMCAGFNLGAQTAGKITVKGTVVDETDQPVIAATVSDKKTNAATVTDLNGNYTISVPSDATLEFSCLGLTTLNIKVGPGL